ncbi:MAG: hypothetical protein AAF849_14415 [Bacteroidota bacterium]
MKREKIIPILQESLTVKEVEHLLSHLHQPVINVEYNTLGFKRKRSFWDWLFRRNTNQVVVFSVLSLFKDFKIDVDALKGMLMQIQQFSTLGKN